MDRRDKGISRRNVLVAAGASVVLTALAEPAQALTITRKVSAGPDDPAQRAALAEQAIVQRHVRTLWGRPQMRLGTLYWPGTWLDQSFVKWCYWWQAHLLDCAVDAAHRDRTPERIERVIALARGIRVRNLTGWTNRYYDDMSWLVLALERADRLLGVRFSEAVDDLGADLVGGWNPEIGAVPWRIDDEYYSTSAIGPAGIAMARLGNLSRARELADFLETRLRDNDTGLIFDGIHEPGGRVDRTALTYCQGAAIGLQTELAIRTGESAHRRRAAALVAAVGDRMTDAGVIAGASGDDSGLFMGILARYLAEAALALGDTTAANIVHASAQAAWQHRAEVDGLPLFGMEWRRPVTVPGPPGTFPQLMYSSAASSGNLSRDLSVQLSGWMLLEADYQLVAAGH